MEIIEIYIYAIQRRLPTNSKEDIAKEIKSLIFDELEGKYDKKEEYTKEEIEKVLTEMGHPREVAQRYRGGKQYLIGKELFPIYKMIIAISTGGTTLGLLISYIVSSITKSSNAWEGISKFITFIPSLLSTLIALFGSITLVFALIERFGKVKPSDINIYEDWKPRDLPELPTESDRVGMWEPLLTITFTIIWMVFLNTYVVSKGGVPFIKNPVAPFTILPVFNIVALKQFLPLWNISLVLSLPLQIVLLRKGKWQIGTRIFEIFLNLFSITILAVMLNGPMIITTDGLISIFSEMSFMDSFEQYYYIGLKVLIVLTSIGIVVNTIKLIVNQARKANI